MRIRSKLPLATAIVALLAGCATQYSEAPLATKFAVTNQAKLQAAAHWTLIGREVATQLKPSVGSRAVYVVPASNEGDFSRALRGQVITSLVNQGVAVSKVPGNNTLSLDLETQLVRFSPERQGNRTVGALTAVTAGLWAINGLDLYPQTAAIAGTVGLAALADWRAWETQQSAGGAPVHEIIVTASLGDSSHIFGRRTDVSYIADSDASLYDNAVVPTLKIKGGQ